MNNIDIQNIDAPIKVAIENLQKDFKEWPDKYLTESDVRCDLVNRLMEISTFSEPQNTKDGSKSVPVHTEIRWYGESGKLKYRSDIVIIDVSTLRTKDKFLRLPSKGYAFNEPKAIIEIKLRRVNGESNEEFVRKIIKDIDKLKEIRKEVNGNYLAYLIILDKKDNIEEKIPQGLGGLEIYYKCSGRNEE